MRKALSLLLALIMCLSLCACGKSEAVKNVETLIDAIGEVSLDSESAIVAAENAYNSLTEEEKATVTNADVLSVARITLDDLKYEQLRLLFVGEWKYLGDSYDTKVFLNADGTGEILEFGKARPTEWQLSRDGTELSFDYFSCEVVAADGLLFLNSDMVCGSFVKASDYQIFAEQYLTVVEITIDNYESYLGTLTFSRNEMDTWGEKIEYTVFAFSNAAYNNGLTYIGCSEDYAMEYTVGGSTYTEYYPYVFYAFGADSPDEISINRIKGTLTFVTNDIVESVTYFDVGAMRVITLKNGLTFYNYFHNNLGMSGLSNDELATLNLIS